MRQTRITTIYTWHQDLIIEIVYPDLIKNIVRQGSGMNLNFSNMDLSEVVAHNLRFYYQNANNSKMMNGHYRKSKFGKSFFEGSDCSDSDFSYCSFCKSIFSESKFINSNLEGSDLRKGLFLDTDFSGASLRNADLRGAIFDGSTFRKTDFRGANIEGVDFSACDMDLAIITLSEKSSVFQLS